MLASAVNEIGPCVAIGRPGEALPHLGFTRLYVADEKWRETVLQIMSKAQLVVIMGGSSSNCAWEVREALQRVERRRLLFLIPRNADARGKFQRILEEDIPGFDRHISDDAALAAQTFTAMLYFRNGMPHYARVETPSHFRKPLTVDIAPVLKMTLRPVYDHLALKWSVPPLVWSRMTFESAVPVFFLIVGLFLVGWL
jgi:hypothetical protein